MRSRAMGAQALDQTFSQGTQFAGASGQDPATVAAELRSAADVLLVLIPITLVSGLFVVGVAGILKRSGSPAAV